MLPFPLFQANSDEDRYGSVIAVFTVTMTVGQFIMGLTAGVLIDLLGSIPRVFLLAATLLTLLTVPIAIADARSWAADEALAREVARRAAVRAEQQRQVRAVRKAAQSLAKEASRDAHRGARAEARAAAMQQRQKQGGTGGVGGGTVSGVE